MDITSFNTGDGSTSFNLQNITYEMPVDGINIQYIGPNQYTVKRLYSGLGIYNNKFVLIKPDGSFLGTNPTTSDEVVITPIGLAMQQIPLDMYLTGQNTWFASNFNWWVTGRFESWMIVKPASTTSNIVRWQTDYPSATTYKIYRDTDPNFGTEVLIHTGTEGVFLDTGLTADTLYYYREEAVVGGVDTDVTTFNCRTKSV